MNNILSDDIEIKIGCIANAMNIIGNKWTALILKDLFTGPKKFCQFEKSITDINPRILSQRLDMLEREKIIASKAQSGSNRKQYYLTKKGTDLLPILQSMAKWGFKYYQ